MNVLQEINLKNLKRVSTYAKIKDISSMWVYKLIERGKLKSINIDGVEFVIKED